MKIKVAVLEKDQTYLNRFVAAFGAKYADKLEIYSFTELNIALAALKDSRVDIFLADESFEAPADKIPVRCGFAYFVESADIKEIKGKPAICKFQKADIIYKEILNLYSEQSGVVAKSRMESGEEAKVILFTSPAGGTGTSTIAAAYALRKAMQGMQVLYLNLETFGNADSYFQAEGNFDFSDILFALKSRKGNLAMKLESYVKEDVNGVRFYSGAKIVLDRMEMNMDDTLSLLEELKKSNVYDYIVIDYGFGLDKDTRTVWKQTNSIVWVSDGSVHANQKTERAYQSFAILERNSEDEIAERLKLVYNRFSDKTGNRLENEELEVAGGAPVYSYSDIGQLLGQIAALEMLDNID